MRTSSILVLTMLFRVASGCSLFHKNSPQQEYAEALMHGNSIQAGQVWLNMSPDDRMKFARGEGFQADQAAQKKDLQQMMMKHYENQSGEGARGTDQIREQMPTSLGASLKDLPAAETPAPSK